MPCYIVEFPGPFYLRGLTSVKDLLQAQRFATELGAREALRHAQKHFGMRTWAAAKIVTLLTPN